MKPSPVPSNVSGESMICPLNFPPNKCQFARDAGAEGVSSRVRLTWNTGDTGVTWNTGDTGVTNSKGIKVSK